MIQLLRASPKVCSRDRVRAVLNPKLPDGAISPITELLVKWCVGVEKVTELTLVSMNTGKYKQSRVPDALDHQTRRLAAYDGTTPRVRSRCFYYFRIEDQVPENHLLGLIDGHVSFELVGEKLRDFNRETGRPSIDPEVLLRILLLGYLYGITSERRLVEELRMHLAWGWFTGLGFDQRDTASFDLFEESSWPISGVESISGVVRAHRGTVHRRGSGRGCRGRSMAASSWRTRATTVVSRENRWGRQHR
jgi:Transposase domain (DUF772)